MEHGVYLRQDLAVEWGLSANEAIMFAFILGAATWADHDAEGYWFLSKGKLASELPLICSKPDSAYRIAKRLVDVGVLDKRVTGNRTWYRATPTGLLWTKAPGARVGSSSAPETPQGRTAIRPRVGPSSAPRDGRPSARSLPQGSVHQTSSSLPPRAASINAQIGERVSATRALPADITPEVLEAYREMRTGVGKPMGPAVERVLLGDIVRLAESVGASANTVLALHATEGWITASPDWIRRKLADSPDAAQAANDSPTRRSGPPRRLSPDELADLVMERDTQFPKDDALPDGAPLRIVR